MRKSGAGMMMVLAVVLAAQLTVASKIWVCQAAWPGTNKQEIGAKL